VRRPTRGRLRRPLWRGAGGCSLPPRPPPAGRGHAWCRPPRPRPRARRARRPAGPGRRARRRRRGRAAPARTRAAPRRRPVRAAIESGPANIWRYAPLLPVPADVSEKQNLAPGWTKLVDARNLARELGLRSLHIKDDSGNPTHSFKDRVVAIALEAARTFGFHTLSCSSTGNLAGAVTAAAARAGLDACVFIPAGLEEAKIVMASIYGKRL